MLNKKIFIAAGAAVLVGAVVITVALANGSATPKNTSNSDLFVLDQLANALPSALPTFGWNDNVLGSASPTKQAALSCPEASTSTGVFVSKRGDERNVAAWLASGESAFYMDTKTVFLPNLKLSGMISGNPNYVKATGGDLSFGVACMTSNSSQITAIDYRFIHVTAGSGDWMLLPIE